NTTSLLPPPCPESARTSLPESASQTPTVPSQLEVATRLPSGEKATPLMAIDAVNLSISFPVRTSQTLAVPSLLAVAIRVPSGLQARSSIKSVCPTNVRMSVPVRASHTKAFVTRESHSPPATRFPSGLKAIPHTPPGVDHRPSRSP